MPPLTSKQPTRAALQRLLPERDAQNKALRTQLAAQYLATILTAGTPLEYFDDPRPLGEALNLVLRQVIA